MLEGLQLFLAGRRQVFVGLAGIKSTSIGGSETTAHAASITRAEASSESAGVSPAHTAAHASAGSCGETWCVITCAVAHGSSAHGSCSCGSCSISSWHNNLLLILGSLNRYKYNEHM